MKKDLINQGIVDMVYSKLKTDYSLTKRELEVVRKINYNGYNNRDLAASFFISEKTIKNHIAHILEKTSTHSTRELQALVFRLFTG